MALVMESDPQQLRPWKQRVMPLNEEENQGEFRAILAAVQVEILKNRHVDQAVNVVEVVQ